MYSHGCSRDILYESSIHRSPFLFLRELPVWAPRIGYRLVGRWIGGVVVVTVQMKRTSSSEFRGEEGRVPKLHLFPNLDFSEILQLC